MTCFFLTISLYCYLCYYFTAITSLTPLFLLLTSAIHSAHSNQADILKCKSYQVSLCWKLQCVAILRRKDKSIKHHLVSTHTASILCSSPLYSIENWMYQSFLDKMLYKSVNSNSFNYFWPVGFHMTVSVSKLENLRDNFISFFISPIRNNQSPITGSFYSRNPLNLMHLHSHLIHAFIYGGLCFPNTNS